MLTLHSLEEAEAFVTEQQLLGNEVFWENYDIVCFRTAPQAFMSTEGAFHKGFWGFKNRSGVTTKGTWFIDPRNVKETEPAYV